VLTLAAIAILLTRKVQSTAGAAAH
jgi:hypothetical protein